MMMPSGNKQPTSTLRYPSTCRTYLCIGPHPLTIDALLHFRTGDRPKASALTATWPWHWPTRVRHRCTCRRVVTLPTSQIVIPYMYNATDSLPC